MTYEELFKKYHKALIARAMRQITNRFSWAEAEEVAQDVWLQAHRDWDDFKGVNKHGEPVTRDKWLFTILLNTCRHFTRDRNRQKVPELVNRNDNEAIENNDGGFDSPEDLCIARETTANLVKALTSMPKQFSEVIRLHYIDGLRCEEIAEVLNTPVNTVFTRLYRARKFIDGLDQKVYRPVPAKTYNKEVPFRSRAEVIRDAAWAYVCSFGVTKEVAMMAARRLYYGRAASLFGNPLLLDPVKPVIEVTEVKPQRLCKHREEPKPRKLRVQYDLHNVRLWEYPPVRTEDQKHGPVNHIVKGDFSHE